MCCRSKVRELIIDLRMPKFDKVKKSDLSKISDLLKILNQEQARAVLKSLMAKDYLIVQGFPGSGLFDYLDPLQSEEAYTPESYILLETYFR